MSGRPWTSDELAQVRDHYHVQTARAIAGRIGRTPSAVHLAAAKLGVTSDRRTVIDETFLAELRRLNADGWPDSDIASHLGCERHAVSRHRNRLGLPSHSKGEKWRERIRYGVALQCQRAGVGSIGELRALVYRQRAHAAGWPSDLRFRAVQILEVLEKTGPMTRRDIADAIGMPWKGSRKSLVSNDPEGSYLAHLIARGLVVRLGRVVKGSGTGHSVNLYSLTLQAERRHVAEPIAATDGGDGARLADPDADGVHRGPRRGRHEGGGQGPGEPGQGRRHGGDPDGPQLRRRHAVGEGRRLVRGAAAGSDPEGHLQGPSPDA